MTLEELIALNDEILALSRAGVPLERGLLEVGRDLPKRLAALATEIGARMEQGEALEQILRDARNGLPRVYGAIVAAGVRSGRLPLALEGVATTLRRLAELRTLVGMTMIYPLVVICLASLLFALYLQHAFSPILSAFEFHRLDVSPAIEEGVRWLARYGHLVGWLPLLVLGCAALWWWRSASATATGSSWLGRQFMGIPGTGQLLRAGRIASFVEVLRLLLDQEVPLPEALPLAAQASGDPGVMADAAQLSARQLRGERVDRQPSELKGIPPLIVWMICSGSTRESLSSALRTTAESYFQRTQYLVDRFRVYLPIWATLGFAGTVTCVYVLTFLIPWVLLLAGLAQS